MRELIILSGKGGTGKTSVAGSLAVLAAQSTRVVLADCDVDASNLPLILPPTIRETHPFRGLPRARIDADQCAGCGVCRDRCRFGAVSFDGPGNGLIAKTFRIDPLACEGCGVCVDTCPARAVDFVSHVQGEWFVSETSAGFMVHARLGIAEENSGKLVSLVRENARRLAREQQAGWVLVDGSPGIGCPVIASLTGADQALIVTEPTASGLHDLRRVAELARHFHIPAAVAVNKWDINPAMTDSIEACCRDMGIPAAGRLRYDPAVTRAQIQRRPVVAVTGSGVAEDIRRLWETLREPPAAPGRARARGDRERAWLTPRFDGKRDS